MLRSLKYNSYLIIVVIALFGCGNKPDGNISEIIRPPIINPDYSGITIPSNIAPVNFIIKEEGSSFYVVLSSGTEPAIRIKSKNGQIRIPQKKWKNLLTTKTFKHLNINVFVKQRKNGWTKFKTITNIIALEPIDPFLSYRLLYPGYESWAELSIQQRNLENFHERPIIENSVADENCVNCHSYNNGRSDDFLFHMRGSMGGTYFYSGGELKKTNLKTSEMKNGSVYPRWHPSGKFVAFSSNKIVQQFHSADNKKVEVSDLESSLILYDVENNEIIPVQFPDKEKYMDTYPEWTPDGKYLYFCRATQIGESYDYKLIRYNLYRVLFNQEKLQFGVAELIFDATKINKSISFPRISPDGRFLVMTMQDFGCFPIWHKETDLYSLNLESLEAVRLDLNSDFTDSYHSWSSNSRWLVFSSKRGDGLTACPYISYIDEDGNSAKPFILPQDDPEFYDRFLKSFNIPEFSNVKIVLNPGEIRKTAKTGAIQAKWSGE
ncbi:MAG: cytochrome C biosynthesis protein [Bacteroidales bacterium]|nr:cytochrome C biosynthesis protein [Bacteroidales bacterium]